MADQQAPPPLPKSQPSFGRRHSTIIKLLGVGALVLVLLIPLTMITGVLSDRLQRRNDAVADITSSWGREQNVIGPVLGIPYQYKFKAVKEVPAPDGKMERREVEETATANAYFLPETLNVAGDAFWSSTMRPDNLSSPTRFTVAGFQNTKYCPTSTPTRVRSPSSRSSWKMKAGNATTP